MVDSSKKLAFSLALLGSLGLSGGALADTGADHQTFQVRPSSLGVSGSSIEHVLDKAFAYCYAGTLGALVTDGTHQYILSNNHVLAKENDPDNALAPDGYNIIQQGLLDEEPGSCTLSLGRTDHIVAYLTDFVPIVFGKGRNLPSNWVDAAIAETNLNSSAPDVDSDGTILDIGALTTPGPVAAVQGDLVQKSGRTTGHTFGQVTATNVTIRVDYNSGTALFVDQLELVGLCGTLFSDRGDSGSLIVTLRDQAPRGAVGLLFAGGGGSTFANPIETVLGDVNEPGPDLYMVTGSIGNVDDVTGNSSIPTCNGGDGGGGGGNGGPPPGRGGGRFNGAVDPIGLEIAAQVAADNSTDLLALPGVLGHGIGANQDGDPVIRIYVEEARRPAGQSIPDNIAGFDTRIVVTGPIRAY